MITQIRSIQIPLLAIAILFALILTATSLQAAETGAKTEDQKAFYFLGTGLGRNLLILNLSESEIQEVIDGLRATLSGNAEQLDESVYGPKLNAIAQQRMAAGELKEAELSQAYLDKMAAEKGAIKTRSGLVYLETLAGKGVQATGTSTVKAHYQGTLRDGTVFDSSYKRGEPLTIPLTNVIPCWTEAIAMMKEGGKSKLSCPADIAYGSNGSGAIPPGAALTFEVELIEVVQ